MVLETWCLGMNDRYVQYSVFKSCYIYSSHTKISYREDLHLYISYQPSTSANIFPVLARVPIFSQYWHESQYFTSIGTSANIFPSNT